MPSMGSYSLECLILEYYETKGSCSKWIDMEVKALLGHLAGAIYRPIYDPKNIQGDLNILPYAEKLKISRRARTDMKQRLRLGIRKKQEIKKQL